jgi:hypothetical protein
VGQSGDNNDLARTMSAGAFDDEYYSSEGQTGRLYVCGSLLGNRSSRHDFGRSHLRTAVFREN